MSSSKPGSPKTKPLANDCLAVPMGYSWRTISWLHGANREHGKRHSPARVLAECAAKRAIVAIHRPVDYGPPPEIGEVCYRCVSPDDWNATPFLDEHWPCSTIRHLAAVYDQHPDYDQAWRV